MTPSSQDAAFRRAVRFVATANLLYFGVEFGIGQAIGSVSLFADSIDFLEDASVNLLILVALGWSARSRARVGMVLAGLLLIPFLATLLTVWRQINHPIAPEPLTMSVTGLGALAVNLTCAFVLVRFRKSEGSLSKAAFLSARNDAFANIGIIGAGAVTLAAPSIWPDLIVGLVIGALNLGAAHEVWEAARKEHATQP